MLRSVQSRFATGLLLTTVPLASAIYQGTHSNCGEHPQAVQIFHSHATGGDGYLCGGTLITPKHVLTASHCIVHTVSNPTVESALGDLEVNLLRCTPDRKLAREGGEKFGVTMIHAQALYLPDGRIDYDIGVIELDRPVKYHPFLADPAWLPKNTAPAESNCQSGDGDRITLMGAGTYGTSQTDISEWLRQVRARVLTHEDCDKRADAAQGAPGATNGFIKDHYFCTIDPVTLGGACGGDSGSGAVEYVEGNTKKQVVGVVSAGPVVCSNPNHVNVYGRVSFWLPWIQSVVGSTYPLKLRG